MATDLIKCAKVMINYSILSWRGGGGDSATKSYLQHSDVFGGINLCYKHFRILNLKCYRGDHYLVQFTWARLCGLYFPESELINEI